jgi:hypothetical protein
MISGHRSAYGRPSPWGDGSLGINSPWDYLYDRNAWWVIVDPKWNLSPLSAYAQARFAERHTGITARTPFPTFNMAKIGRILERQGDLHKGQWGDHLFVTMRVKSAVNVILKTLEEEPEQLEPEPDFRQWLDTKEFIQEKGYIHCGTSKHKITPPIPCNRWEGKELVGISRDIYARVVVLSHGTQKIALVLCDLLGISGELVNKIRNKIHRNIGFPGEAIQIACTHSHSTPDTIGAGFEDQEYLQTLIDTICTAISEADAHQVPARLGWGRVPIRGLAHSRRKTLKDGTVYTTRYGVPSTWRVKPELIASEGQIDPDLTVVRIENLNGEIIAAISNFGCHASVALMSTHISGDFPGEAMHILEGVLGESSVVLCTNGAGADVDPTLEMPYWGPRTDANAHHLGRIFAAQVLEELARIQVDDIIAIDAAQELVNLPVRSDWISLLEKEQERMEQEFSHGWQLSSVTKRILQDRLIQTEIQALRVGGLVLVGFPGELFVESGLNLKSKFDDPAVAVLELANDNIGYLPTHSAFNTGGYEVARNLWGRVSPEGVDTLMNAAQRVVNIVTTA